MLDKDNQIKKGWRFKLKGNENDLEHLSKVFIDEDINIFQDIYYFMMSSQLNLYIDFEEALEKAEEIITLINNSLVIVFDSLNPIEITEIDFKNEDGSSTIYSKPFSFELKYHFSSYSDIPEIDENGNLIIVREVDSVKKWLKAAQKHDSVKKVLRLYKREEQNWVNLYRIYEVIEEDSKNLDNIVKKGWATKKAINNFKHTSCSPEVTGDQARHGKSIGLPPRNPISLIEARALIRSIFTSWISSKV